MTTTPEGHPVTEPREPAHADKTVRLGGVDPRLSLYRELLAYDVTTPRYRWHLLLDGRPTGRWDRRKGAIVANVRDHPEVGYWTAYGS